jgi:hypothetical protein
VADPDSYLTPGKVENAIKDAAKKAAAVDLSLDVNKRIQLEYFNRFLSRVFSEGADSERVLKGGTGILARVPSTRSTRDIDLYRAGFTLAAALDDLNRLASIDLGDHFSFEYAGHTDSIGTDTQPYTEGYQVKFNIFIGAAAKGTLRVDLAVGAGMTGEVITTPPATSLALPRLVNNPYRLYPVVDQIADKVCATMTAYRDKASSREKDLVDLVVFATTQDVDGTALRIAITTEARRRKMEPFDHFTVPPTWGPGYTKLSKPVPYCSAYPTVELATALAARLVDPALVANADSMIWDHSELAWRPLRRVARASPAE